MNGLKVVKLYISLCHIIERLPKKMQKEILKDFNEYSDYQSKVGYVEEVEQFIKELD